MNKKQKLFLIIWAILLVIVGITWLSTSPHCIDANQYGGCSRYTWDLSGLIGKFLIISAPAAILYFIFQSSKKN